MKVLKNYGGNMDILLQICLSVILVSITSVIATMSAFFIICFFNDLFCERD
jgi:hypothetical protein